ncbi:MAG: DNA repair protein RadC [Agarilytica sp.]
MAITDWPTQDRPREKLCTQGAHVLSDTELLAIFLRTGCAGKSAVDLARELILTFGSLRGLLEASEAQFCEGRGLGTAKYAQLQAVLEMAKRHLAENLHANDALTSSRAVKAYVKAKMRHLTYEAFAVLFLDSQHQLITYDELFRGTIDAAAVYPREVVVQALHHNASAVIFAHNHPSGHPEPSASDIELTNTLKSSLNLIDIRALDHLIAGEGEVYSFAENGKI